MPSFSRHNHPWACGDLGVSSLAPSPAASGAITFSSLHRIFHSPHRPQSRQLREGFPSPESMTPEPSRHLQAGRRALCQGLPGASAACRLYPCAASMSFLPAGALRMKRAPYPAPYPFCFRLCARARRNQALAGGHQPGPGAWGYSPDGSALLQLPAGCG